MNFLSTWKVLSSWIGKDGMIALEFIIRYTFNIGNGMVLIRLHRQGQDAKLRQCSRLLNIKELCWAKVNKQLATLTNLIARQYSQSITLGCRRCIGHCNRHNRKRLQQSLRKLRSWQEIEAKLDKLSAIVEVAPLVKIIRRNSPNLALFRRDEDALIYIPCHLFVCYWVVKTICLLRTFVGSKSGPKMVRSKSKLMKHLNKDLSHVESDLCLTRAQGLCRSVVRNGYLQRDGVDVQGFLLNGSN